MRIHFYFFAIVWVLGTIYAVTDDITMIQRIIIITILTAGFVADYFASKPKKEKIRIGTPEFAQMAQRIDDDGNRTLTHMVAGHMVFIKAVDRFENGEVKKDKDGKLYPPKFMYSYRLPESNTTIDVESEFLTINELMYDVMNRINKG